MERMMDQLLKDYEQGKMNRRQLIRRLALSATAALTANASVASPLAATGFKTVALDHISYRVSDYSRTRDFYAELMGMTVHNDNGTSQCQLSFGESRLIARNHRNPSEADGSKVDHIAYKIEDWNTDSVKAELERRGLEPRLDTGGGDGYASFHVSDPDGYDLQISGDLKPGDSLYKG